MSDVHHISIKSPFGDLTVFEDGGAIAALEWGRVPGGAPTPLLKKAATQLAEYFAGTRKEFDLPLRPQGTPFQKKVWRALQKTPCGQTETYGALAKKLKTAPRAVGGACGANPIPVLIPCHRVLGTGGALGGFSGGDGVATKARMLAFEGVEMDD